MADTIRNEAALQALLADNTAGDISAQDVRDLLVSVPSLASTANLALAGGTMTGTITSTLGTLAGSSTPAFSSTATWNNGATTFTHILANITRTASAAGSMFMDMQIGGTSQFNVVYNGTNPVLNLKSTTATVYSMAGSGSSLLFYFGGTTANTLVNFDFGGSRLIVDRQISLVAAGTASAPSNDTAIGRNAAGVVEINNGTAGTFRDLLVRNAYLGSTSNYLSHVSSYGIQVVISTNKRMQFDNDGMRLTSAGAYRWASSSSDPDAAPDLAFRRVAAGVVAIDTGTAGAGATLAMWEQTAPSAPAANGVRIYAEDNGAGKTRLMALFQSGAAQQIAIEP